MIYHCLIIGAGQAGLACAQIAEKSRLSYLVLERGSQAGEAWLRRAPDLELFTPRSLSVLSGLALAGEQNAAPKAGEMAKYFEAYRKRFDINCRFNSWVVTSEYCREGFWKVTCYNGQTFHGYSLVLANGSNQKICVPKTLSQGLSPDVVQVNAENYWRTPPDVDQPCLVVGDGASGRQIARDLARGGHQVSLAGKGRNLIPSRWMKRNILHWLNASGFLRADRSSVIGRWLRKRSPIPRKETLSQKALVEIGVSLVDKVSLTSGNRVFFDDGTQACFRYVVWCLGYEEATDFLPLEFQPDEQWVIAGRGTLPLKGVFVVGRRWLHNRASELIMGAEKDAQHTIGKLKEWLIVDLKLRI